MSSNYRHDEASGVDLTNTGEVLTLRTEGADTVTLTVDGDVTSDYALDVDTGDGAWETFASPSGGAIAQSYTVAVRRVRVRNTTGQTSGDTADVRLGAV